MTKNWKRRVWWWITASILLIIFYRQYPTLIPGFILLAIILDEKIKEGYWFKKTDVGKPLTHEFLFVIGLIGYLIVSILRDILCRRREDK